LTRVEAAGRPDDGLSVRHHTDAADRIRGWAEWPGGNAGFEQQESVGACVAVVAVSVVCAGGRE